MSRINPRRLLLAAACGSLGALAACEHVNEVVGSEFNATLTGANVVPAGDPDGWGRADTNINDSTNQICTDLEVRSIGPVTAAHIHRGAAGVNGPPVVTLNAPDDNDSDDCDVIADALADEIRANPGGFYVNVHTAEYPNGAIRGQLVRRD